MGRTRKQAATPVEIAVRPRNTVFAALMQRVTRSGAGGRHVDARTQRRADDRDLADRIREVGEW